MNNEFLTELLKVILIAVIPMVSGYVVKFLMAKFSEINTKIDNDKIESYLKQIEKIIISAVKLTNQTFVDLLKKEGGFTNEAKLEAFNKTKAAILALLTEELKEAIAKLYGDVNIWLEATIEATVADVKSGKK